MRTPERPVIRAGARVYASDGIAVGDVTEASAGYFVVGENAVFPSDYFIPILAVVRASGRRVDLDVSTAEALASGWDRGQALPA